MNVEGILLRKTPYKEKDLICEFLLRNGQLFSAYFYGGQGSERKKTSSILELGHLLKITTSGSKKERSSELMTAKEWEVVWHSDHIRKNFKAFYLLNFYAEFLLKIATKFNHGDDFQHDENSGLFKVLSNSLFFMDESVAQKKFDETQHLFLFLSKLILELGVVPQLDECMFCGIDLQGTNALVFDVKDGGFICHDCSNQRFDGNLNQLLVDGYSIYQNLNHSLKNKYSEYSRLQVTQAQVKQLMNYLCYQFDFQVQDFKSYAVVF
jgi:DNA repair protein RecO